jgi:eukaryotic-like serine/threonine-protein kinase
MPLGYAIPLGASFRFVHEPLDCSGDTHLKRFVGRKDELEEIVARLLLSNGGAFLVTGYRGVGKSTFVNRVLEELRLLLPTMATSLGPLRLVDVHVNVPRAMDSIELMFHVLRGLYLRLSALNLLTSLEPALRRDLELAFSRTSRTIALKTSSGIEGAAGVSLSAPLPQILKSSSGITFGTKRSRAETHEIAYLTYDDKAAEYDLIDIARRLSNGQVAGPDTWLDRLRRRWNGSIAPAVRLKILFVFDEMDKIEDAGTPGGGIDVILANLKTLFTTSGIAFLFVAGKDVHDRWLEDIGRGDSVYESVFSYALYLSPLWQLADPMCDPFLDAGAFGAVDAADAAAAYAAFKKFIAFSGRGIPRRVLRKFNERVRWGDRRAQLMFSRDDVRQFRFFADLYDVLIKAESELIGELLDDQRSGRVDRQRLGIYYLVDWILVRGVDEFTVQDAVAASRRLSRLIAPADEAAPELIRRLLDVLLKHSYIETAGPTNEDSAVPLAAQANNPPRYRLTRKRLVEMGSLAGVVEQEAQVVIDETRSERFGGRYEVTSVLGRGGMSTVYLARDRVLGRQVALKELLAEFEARPDARERFRREAEALSRLQHANIVRIYDVGVHAKTPYIVMEYVEGVRLTDVIGTELLTDEAEILRIAHDVIAALDFIHNRGILWGDAKPGNIMITPQGRVVLIDFGVSRVGEAPAIDMGMLIGTPDYSSPEQLRGEPIDARSDIYCVGLVLYQVVSGRLPFAADGTVGTALRRIAERPDPPGDFGISDRLNAVILKCLEPHKEDRYATAAELLNDLPPPSSPHTLQEKAQQLLSRNVDTETPDSATSVFNLLEDVERSSVGTGAIADAADADAASLVMDDGTVRVLHGTRVRIGRSSDNDIVIGEPAASRFQAELTRTRDGWVVTDQNSRNTTMLNGAPVSASVVLRDGDVIAVGRTAFVFRDAPGTAAGSGQRVRRNDLYEFIEDLRARAATAPIEEVMIRGLDRAIEISRAERAFTMLANDEGELEFSVARARGGVTLAGSEFSVSRKIPEKVFQTGQLSVVTDLLDGDLAQAHIGTVALGIRHVLCVPMSARQGDERVGVLYLDSRERGTLLSANIQETLRVLAVEIADIVRRGRLLREERERGRMEQELKVAANIQQSLQPPPECAGAYFELSMRMVASRSIGGDFSDYLEFDATRFAFALGDVAGKGPPAALLAALLLGSFRSSARPDSTPSRVVAATNRMLVSHNRESRFATLVHGVLSSDGTLTYCNAGHNPPILLRSDSVVRLEEGGPIVGLFEHAAYEDNTVKLVGGDLVVVFSDGISEAINREGNEFGDERIRQTVEQHRNESTSTIADAVVGAVTSFASGQAMSDDYSVMVVRYRG